MVGFVHIFSQLWVERTLHFFRVEKKVNNKNVMDQNIAPALPKSHAKEYWTQTLNKCQKMLH